MFVRSPHSCPTVLYKPSTVDDQDRPYLRRADADVRSPLSGGGQHGQSQKVGGDADLDIGALGLVHDGLGGEGSGSCQLMIPPPEPYSICLHLIYTFAEGPHLVVVDGSVRCGVLQQDSAHVVTELEVTGGQHALVDHLGDQTEAVGAGLDDLDGLGVALALRGVWRRRP